MRKSPLIFLMGLLIPNPLLSQQQSRPLPTKLIQARGCVQPTKPVKQEGCLVLHDIRQNRLYDLSFSPTAERPELYTHISFEGIGFAHDAQCSHGRPVHVRSWKRLPGVCARPDSAASKSK